MAEPPNDEATVIHRGTEEATVLYPVGLDGPAVPTGDLPLWSPSRYEDLQLLGRGGMAEVRSQRDLVLGRRVAVKTLHPELMERRDATSRFMQEAQLVAQLAHPGIVPVHELGTTPTGQLYFTMREVEGRTLAEEAIDAHREPMHASSPALYRLLRQFQSACEAVAYAHARGVVHRDLKPANILVGAYGEVQVADWGLAAVVGGEEPDRDDSISTRRTLTSEQTHDGYILGTPSYMPPEQARGDIHRLRPPSDVYALGATLYFLLTLRPPFRGSSPRDTLRQVLTAPLKGLPSWVPQPIADLCNRALHPDPEERPADAGALVAELGRWLDGTEQLRRAHELVEEGRPLLAQAATLRDQAEAQARAGRRLLSEVPSSAPAEAKEPAWRLLDRAQADDVEAVRLQSSGLRALHAALEQAPELPAAHVVLAVFHQEAHRLAESRNDPLAALPHELAMREHTEALGDAPVASPLRDYLRGEGELVLATEPSAQAVAYTLQARDRRLEPGAPVPLGRTPLTHPLPAGSWLVELTPDGGTPTRVPVLIERQQRGTQGPPDQPERPHRLPADPPSDTISHISAGWCLAGGDPLAPNGHPRRRLWVGAMRVDTHPVTNRRYLAFLDALSDSGRHEQAVALVPATPAPAYVHTTGGWQPSVDEEGDAWLLDYPVLYVDMPRALAFAAWRREETGEPWRLPSEWEWIRFARGADGRTYPWGDHFEPTWAAIRSAVVPPCPASVDRYPHDVSVFGVRHLAGNAAEWTTSVADAPLPDGAVAPGPVLPPAGDPLLVLRGGHWHAADQRARLASRFFARGHSAYSTTGFRLVCSEPG